MRLRIVQSCGMRSAAPDPPSGLDEKATLSAFLDWYRDVVVRKVEDLDREPATRRLVPSNSNLLGILKHLAFVERGWFQRRFMGSDVFRVPAAERGDREFMIETGETVAGVVAFYQAECEQSRRIVAEHELDEESRQPEAGERRTTLRWIMVHMIEETARHAGQMDILRELTDGAQGE
jgi:uncharacterized damage-inducible protein DinB